ncbi:MAG: V-type ATP synthase subunit E [Anaerolineales bacterium]
MTIADIEVGEVGASCQIQRVGDVAALQAAIMAEARQDARRILDDAEAEASSLLRLAERQANAQRAEIVARAAEEAESYRRHTVAAARLAAQNLKLQQREMLLDGVFEAASERLSKLPESETYGDIVQHLIRQAVARLEVEAVVIHADARTREVLNRDMLDALGRELGVELRLGERLEAACGVVMETPDGRCCYDNTFSSRLERMRDDLRAPVYEALMGRDVAPVTEAPHGA